MKNEELIDEFFETFNNKGKGKVKPKGNPKDDFAFAPPKDPSEQALEIAANWLNNESNQEELQKMEMFVKNARKKLEVFAIQRAMSQATKYANLFAKFHRTILPLVTDPDQLAMMTPKELIAVAQLTYTILEKEGDSLNQFLQKGPSEVPPIAGSKMALLQENEENTQAVETLNQFEQLPSKSRDKLRTLIEALEATARKK